MKIDFILDHFRICNNSKRDNYKKEKYNAPHKIIINF